MYFQLDLTSTHPIQSKCAEIFRNADTGQYSFLCFHCGKCFHFFIDISDHIEQNHSIILDNIKVESMETGTELIKIEFCGEQTVVDPLNENESLVNHINVASTEDNDNEHESLVNHMNVVSTVDNSEKDTFLKGTNLEEILKSEDQVQHNVNDVSDADSLDKPFKCTICGRSYEVKKSFRNHMRIKHSIFVSRKLKKEKKRIKIAPNIADKPESFQCDRCSMRYDTSKSLYEHLRNKHGIYQTGFSIAADETVDQIFKCTACGRAYSSRLKLIDHLRERHNIYQNCDYKCDICGKNFQSKLSILKHLRRHQPKIKNFKCTQCHRAYEQQYLLKLHIERQHTNVKPYKCELCERRYSSRYTLSAHNRLHSGDNIYQCFRCGECFHTKNYLNTHTKRTHLYAERLFKCTSRDKRFFTGYALKMHEIIHSGLRPFECEHCGKMFAAMKVLRNHRLIHLEKRYECKICGKKFAQSAGRRGHEKICPIKEFKSNSN